MITELEKQHQDYGQAQETMQAVQDEYYRYGADISKTEQQLQHQRSLVAALEGRAIHPNFPTNRVAY